MTSLPLNKHVNKWFNRCEPLHLLGQRRDPLCSESAPSCQHSSSGAWDCCPCYKHTKTKCSLGEVGQQPKYATEPRTHFTPVKQIHKHFYEATMPVGLDYESGRFCFPSLGSSPQTHVGWVSIIHFYRDVRMLTATLQCFYRNWDEQECASMLPEPPESHGIFWAPF